jgi:hypothetical protein
MAYQASFCKVCVGYKAVVYLLKVMKYVGKS